MSTTHTITALAGVALAGSMLACTRGSAPPPGPMMQPDTVVVTREVPVALPEGRPITICLASGQAVEVLIALDGDTLVGPDRSSLKDLRPVLGFEGAYADGRAWFVGDEAVTLDGRAYRKFGTPAAKACAGLKIVGEKMGVNLFADAAATSPFETVYVPVRPGVFQPYRAQVGRVRG